jgi:hypothetical protein
VVKLLKISEKQTITTAIVPPAMPTIKTCWTLLEILGSFLKLIWLYYKSNLDKCINNIIRITNKINIFKQTS